MKRVDSSRFFEGLLERYPRSPSIALCRIPELELLSELDPQGPVLDHCCGDGLIVQLAFPGRTLDAGVDLNPRAVAAARARGNYREVVEADAARGLPFADGSFGCVVNNSGIEHIPDLDAAVAHVARVLRPGGEFCFNVLNSRYFDWWPLAPATVERYRRFQPFLHALDEEGWRGILTRHGFADVRFTDYFPRETAQYLADYDYRYSAFYLTQRLSPGVVLSAVTPKFLLRRRWRERFGALPWDAAPGQGAGFMVRAKKA